MEKRPVFSLSVMASAAHIDGVTAKIQSVNVTEPRIIAIKGKEVATSIWKRAQLGKIEVDHSGIAGETRIAKSMCDSADHALYFYPYEHYAAWQRELDCAPFPFGQFGENITCSGLLETEVHLGDVLRCGGVTVRVRQPRLPCVKLDARMGRRFAGRFLRSRRVGFITRVLEAGALEAGDEIVVLERDGAAPTVDDLFRLTQLDMWDADGLARLLTYDALPAAWREITMQRWELARHADGWHGLRPLRIIDRRAGKDAVVLTLACPYGKVLPRFAPGQSLIVAWRPTPDASSLRRPYAVTSDPEDPTRYQIIVQRLGEAPSGHDDARKGGIVSTALREQVSVGDVLWTTAPRGHTTLAALGAEPRGALFLSEGLGIATVLPLLGEWSRRFSRVPAAHVHVAATPPAAEISDAIAQLALPTLRRVRVRELPSAVALRELAAGMDHIFVAGSSAFSDEIEACFAGADATLHVERFGDVR